jgi:hypothetical protein
MPAESTARWSASWSAMRTGPGVLAGALGRAEDAQRWLEDALHVHRRLGARV